MKILNQPVSSMYIWALLLLSLIAVISAYTLRAFPSALALSVVVAAAIEIVIKSAYLKHAPKIPFSGIITGLIIGSVAPINSPLALVFVADAVAIVSKTFLTYRSSNIFNPATVGLLAALPIFGVGDAWWAAGNYNIYGMALSLTPILIILAYKARRLVTGVSFVASSLVLGALFQPLGPLSLTSLAAMLLGINYYFAFVMLIEPKTSPNNRNMQIAYGAMIAVVYLLFTITRLPYSLLLALLVGNLVYLIYRRYGRR